VHRFDRRDFMRKSTFALAAGWLSNRVSPVLAASEKNKQKQPVNLEFRTLGKTDLRVSTVGYGAMRTTDPSVLEKALDMGINFVDTAYIYQGGNNEKLVGSVLKGRRKDVILCTKIKPNSRKKMAEMFETSLRRLQTDYVDILYLHSLKEISDLYHEPAMELFMQWKKAGKIRFLGFSTHKNETVLLSQASKDKFWDVILVAYNFKKEKALTRAVDQAAGAGIGIVGMKTQAGGYETKEMGGLSPHQAALKWVLRNPNVHATIPSMVSFAQLEENVRVMGRKMGWYDRKTLEYYSHSIDLRYCRTCGACKGTCPSGVDIPEVNRCFMYYEGYRDRELALANYDDLLPEHRADKCGNCPTCQARCKYGIDLARRMRQINVTLGRG